MLRPLQLSFTPLYAPYDKKSLLISNSYAVVSTLAVTQQHQSVKPMSVIPAHVQSAAGAEKAAEPPSCFRSPIFMIGQDSRGNWVAQEKSGARGGVFVDRAGALKFVKFETVDVPHAVVWVNGILELNASATSAKMSEESIADSVQRERRAA